jgi:hypothetical protein
MKIMNTTNLSMPIRRIAIMLFLFCSFTLLNAQTYTLNTNLGTITTCSGTFTDGGGNYSSGANYTVTFCSGSTATIQIAFSAFNTESGYDIMEFFDGATTGATSLGSSTGNIGANVVQSSGSCLTIRFTSDGSITASGWSGCNFLYYTMFASNCGWCFN